MVVNARAIGVDGKLLKVPDVPFKNSDHRCEVRKCGPRAGGTHDADHGQGTVCLDLSDITMDACREDQIEDHDIWHADDITSEIDASTWPGTYF